MEGDMSWASVDSVQTLRFLRRLVTDECVSPAAVGYSWDHPINLLAFGQTAMTIGGTYEAETLAEQTGVGQRAMWDRYGFAPIPAGPRATLQRRWSDGLRRLSPVSATKGGDAVDRARRGSPLAGLCRPPSRSCAVPALGDHVWSRRVPVSEDSRDPRSAR